MSAKGAIEADRSRAEARKHLAFSTHERDEGTRDDVPAHSNLSPSVGLQPTASFVDTVVSDRGKGIGARTGEEKWLTSQS